MKVTTLLFDLDGTLLDTLEDLTDSVNFALTNQGYPLRSKEQVKSFLGNGIKKLVERSAPQEISLEAYERLLDDFRKHYSGHCDKKTTPFEGIVEVVKCLAATGYHLGVISNKSHRETAALIEEFFGNTFSFVLGSSEDLPRKPQPDGLKKAMAYFRVTPQETLYIGDSDVDVATAHNGAVFCIGVAWGFRGREVLAAAGADGIIDTPKELFSMLEKMDG